MVSILPLLGVVTPMSLWVFQNPWADPLTYPDVDYETQIQRPEQFRQVSGAFEFRFTLTIVFQLLLAVVIVVAGDAGSSLLEVVADVFGCRCGRVLCPTITRCVSCKREPYASPLALPATSAFRRCTRNCWWELSASTERSSRPPCCKACCRQVCLLLCRCLYCQCRPQSSEGSADGADAGETSDRFGDEADASGSVILPKSLEVELAAADRGEPASRPSQPAAAAAQAIQVTADSSRPDVAGATAGVMETASATTGLPPDNLGESATSQPAALSVQTLVVPGQRDIELTSWGDPGAAEEPTVTASETAQGITPASKYVLSPAASVGRVAGMSPSNTADGDY